MVARRTNPYAKVYSYGANGSAVRAGSPIASQHTIHSHPRARARKRLEVRAPLWVIVLVVAAAVFFQAFAMLGMQSGITGEQKHINTLTRELAKVQESIDSLEVSIAQASDPSRIHSIAVNRLGMRQPTPEQIHLLPRPEAPYKADESARPQEGGGVLRMLLSLVGL